MTFSPPDWFAKGQQVLYLTPLSVGGVLPAETQPIPLSFHSVFQPNR